MYFYLAPIINFTLASLFFAWFLSKSWERSTSSNINVKVFDTYQGPKLTFLGTCQWVTEIFFSVTIWKNVVSKKCQINLSFAVKHKLKFLVPRWNILVANFFFKNQNKKNAFGAAMPNNNKIKTQTGQLFLHLC